MCLPPVTKVSKKRQVRRATLPQGARILCRERLMASSASGARLIQQRNRRRCEPCERRKARPATTSCRAKNTLASAADETDRDSTCHLAGTCPSTESLRRAPARLRGRHPFEQIAPWLTNSRYERAQYRIAHQGRLMREEHDAAARSARAQAPRSCRAHAGWLRSVTPGAAWPEDRAEHRQAASGLRW